MQEQETKGKAVDLDPRQRPGVPMERAPQPQPGARAPIERQHSDVRVLRHGGRKDLPPVYGTTLPPHGVSGMLRKLAYRYPDHWARHWMVLLAADRVDVWEHRLRRSLRGGLAVASVLVLGGLTFRLLRR